MNRIASYYQSGDGDSMPDEVRRIEDNSAAIEPAPGQVEEEEVYNDEEGEPLPAWASVAIDVLRSKRFLDHADKWRASIDARVEQYFNIKKEQEESEKNRSKEDAKDWRETLWKLTLAKYALSGLVVVLLTTLTWYKIIPTDSATPLFAGIVASLFVQPRKEKE